MTGAVHTHFSPLYTDPVARLSALEAYLRAHIPLTGAMQVHAPTLDQHGLCLSAPLAANRNHQGSAFGGSLASLAVLAGWGLLWLLLDQGHGTNIVVRDMQMEFLHPVQGSLLARCAWPAAQAWEKFNLTLKRRHKARLELQTEIHCQERLCARCTCLFVAQGGTPEHA